MFCEMEYLKLSMHPPRPCLPSPPPQISAFH